MKLCRYDLKVCDDGKLVQILGYGTVSIVLSLSKMSTCLCSKTQRFGDWTIYWTKLSRFYLKMEIESSLRNAVF
jgi:hypothetical protein